MAKLFELDNCTLRIREDRATTRLSERGRCLRETDQTVKLGNYLDSSKPRCVVLIEPSAETGGYLPNDLAMGLLYLL